MIALGVLSEATERIFFLREELGGKSVERVWDRYHVTFYHYTREVFALFALGRPFFSFFIFFFTNGSVILFFHLLVIAFGCYHLWFVIEMGWNRWGRRLVCCMWCEKMRKWENLEKDEVDDWGVDYFVDEWASRSAGTRWTNAHSSFHSQLVAIGLLSAILFNCYQLVSMLGNG